MTQPTRRSARVKRPTPRSSSTTREDNERVSVSGGLHASLTEIRSSNANLIATFGKGEGGRDILVPLVDWRLYGQKISPNPSTNEDTPELFGNLLTFDNLAFLLQDIGCDMLAATKILTKQSNCYIMPLEGQMRYTADMLRRASGYLSAAAEEIDNELVGRDEIATGKDD